MKIGSIALNVTNLEQSLNFYQELFDFNIIYKSNNVKKKYVFLGKKGNLVLSLWEVKKNEQKSKNIHHLAFKFKNIKKLKKYEKKIKRMNKKNTFSNVELCSKDIFSNEMIFYDPNGIKLEFYIHPWF